MGMEKYNNQNNAKVLYVVMFGDGKGPIVMHILENKYGGNVTFMGGLNSFSKNQTQRSQENVW
jgi:hypothetical protein